MLNILRLRLCVRTRSGQRSQLNVFIYCGPGSIRRAAKSSQSSKVLGEGPRRILHAYEGNVLKGQGQDQFTKVNIK